MQGAFSQEKKAQNQIYLNTKRDRLHCKRSLIIKDLVRQIGICRSLRYPQKSAVDLFLAALHDIYRFRFSCVLVLAFSSPKTSISQ